MDTSKLTIEYKEEDFAHAYRELLPKGEYWQDKNNTELTNTINGIAKDFKKTHDDIELSLLGQFKQQEFGWKISDYQSLLNSMNSKGTVKDEKNRPNLILIELDSYDNERAIQAFEQVRLPHTELNWLYDIDAYSELNSNTGLTLLPHLVSEIKLESELNAVYSDGITFSPQLKSEIKIQATAQLLCHTAMAWYLNLGEFN